MSPDAQDGQYPLDTLEQKHKRKFDPMTHVEKVVSAQFDQISKNNNFNCAFVGVKGGNWQTY